MQKGESSRSLAFGKRVVTSQHGLWKLGLRTKWHGGDGHIQEDTFFFKVTQQSRACAYVIVVVFFGHPLLGALTPSGYAVLMCDPFVHHFHGYFCSTILEAKSTVECSTSGGLVLPLVSLAEAQSFFGAFQP